MVWSSAGIGEGGGIGGDMIRDHISPVGRAIIILPFVLLLDGINLLAISAKWLHNRVGCDVFLLPQIWENLQRTDIDD